MHIKKKGISPLIATILIIGFTVALAAVIMTWGQSFTKSITKGTESTTNEQLACANDVKFNIGDACSSESAPGADDEIQVTIGNDGNKQLESLAVRFFTAANDVQVVTVNTPLAAFAIRTDILGGLNLASGIKKVEVIPVVKVGDSLITCSNSFESFGDNDLVNGQSLRVC